MLLMIKNVTDTRLDFDVAKINYIWNHEIYALHINALVNFLKRILRNLNNFFKTKESI